MHIISNIFRFLARNIYSYFSFSWYHYNSTRYKFIFFFIILGCTETEEVAFIEDFIICIEMLFIAIAFSYAFGQNSYRGNNSGIRDWGELGQIHEVRHLPENAIPLVQKFVKANNPKDVAVDAFNAYTKRAKRYVVVADYLSLPIEEQLQRVIKKGGIEKQGEGILTGVIFILYIIK